MTAVNRSSKPLKYTWTGIHYEMKPGKHFIPEQNALAFKNQNPIMGSDDETTGNFQYLVGIEEEPYSDDCSPVEQADLIELYNRKHLRDALPVMVVAGKAGMYAPRGQGAALPIDGTGFVDPTK